MPENVTLRRDPDGEAGEWEPQTSYPGSATWGIVGAPGGLAERAFGVDGSNRKEITDGVARVVLCSRCSGPSFQPRVRICPIGLVVKHRLLGR